MPSFSFRVCQCKQGCTRRKGGYHSLGEVVHGVEACGSLTVRMKILKRRMEENMMEKMTKILIESADKQCSRCWSQEFSTTLKSRFAPPPTTKASWSLPRGRSFPTSPPSAGASTRYQSRLGKYSPDSPQTKRTWISRGTGRTWPRPPWGGQLLLSGLEFWLKQIIDLMQGLVCDLVIQNIKCFQYSYTSLISDSQVTEASA